MKWRHVNRPGRQVADGVVVVSPFVVLVDKREQAPYTFANITEKDGRVRVDRKWATLGSGDYSIEGFEERVAIERKSLPDLFSSLGKGRERFEREMIRLSAFDFAALVVEGEWSTIVENPPKRSRLSSKVVLRTCFAWTQRYGVPWFCFPGRRAAEVATFRLLDRWWRDWFEASAAAAGECRFCGRRLESARSIDCGMGPYCRKAKAK